MTQEKQEQIEFLNIGDHKYAVEDLTPELIDLVLEIQDIDQHLQGFRGSIEVNTKKIRRYEMARGVVFNMLEEQILKVEPVGPSDDAVEEEEKEGE